MEQFFTGMGAVVSAGIILYVGIEIILELIASIVFSIWCIKQKYELKRGKKNDDKGHKVI